MSTNDDSRLDDDIDDLLTLREVAELLRIPEATLRYWRNQHIGPDSYKVGRHVRYPRGEVQRWLRSQRSSRSTDVELDDVRLPDGTRLTDDVADAIVTDVKRRAGRPSLTGASETSPRVSFRATPEVRDRAAAIATEEGKTISQLARVALEARVQAS